MEKEKEEELRAKVIEYLSSISEEWDEGISQALMVSPFDYYYAYSSCKNGLVLWTKALKILKKLIKLNKDKIRKGSE